MIIYIRKGVIHIAEKKRSSERTSYEVRRKWDSEHMQRITFLLDKDLVIRFKEKCSATGITQASIIRSAMQDFLED